MTVYCETHELSVCSRCFPLLHTNCTEIRVVNCEELFNTCLKCIKDTINEIRDFNAKFHTSLSKKWARFDDDLDFAEEKLINLKRDKRSYHLKVLDSLQQMRNLKTSIAYQEYASEIIVRQKGKLDIQTKIEDFNFDSKVRKIVEEKEREIRSDFDRKINDLNQKCSALDKNLNSKVDKLDNEFTSKMENLSLDHNTLKDKVEKIEARQTAQEEELIKFSKETSEIKNLLIEGFGGMMKGMSDMNKDTNNMIESLNDKLDSHIKV